MAGLNGMLGIMVSDLSLLVETVIEFGPVNGDVLIRFCVNW